MSAPALTAPSPVRGNAYAVSAASSVGAGESVLGASWTQLSAKSIPCSFLILSAPTAAHPKAGANSAAVLYLIGKTIPTSAAGAAVIATTNTGFILPVDDPSLVWLLGTASDAVEWQALQG